MRHGSGFTFRLLACCAWREHDERRSGDFIQRTATEHRVKIGRSKWQRIALFVLWLLVPAVDSACTAMPSLCSFWLHHQGATFLSIPAELEAKILRYYHVDKWRVGTIARQLQGHHGTVQRVLRRAGLPAAQSTARASKADP